LEVREEDQVEIEEFVTEKLGDPNSEIIYEMLRLVHLEDEVDKFREAVADLKFSMI
jgi:hypothetical protein